MNTCFANTQAFIYQNFIFWWIFGEYCMFGVGVCVNERTCMFGLLLKTILCLSLWRDNDQSHVLLHECFQ